MKDLMTALREVITVGASEVGIAVQLLGEHPGLSPRDAIHAAVALGHGLDGIVTTDRAFSQVRGMTAFDPRDLVPDA